MQRKKIINYLIIGLVFIIILWLIIQWKIDRKIEKNNANIFSEYDAKKMNVDYNEAEDNKNNIDDSVEKKAITNKEYPKEEIELEYKNYEVLAKLEIPEIKLETYILQTCTNDSLNKSVAKFWGVNPNQIGNCCIAGHNAPRNNNMFYSIKKLEIGNTLTISDNNIGRVEYEIYNIYNVFPDDVSCLAQETKGTREVTLITCTNDSSKRTIVKAREKI